MHQPNRQFRSPCNRFKIVPVSHIDKFITATKITPHRPATNKLNRFITLEVLLSVNQTLHSPSYYLKIEHSSCFARPIMILILYSKSIAIQSVTFYIVICYMSIYIMIKICSYQTIELY